MRPRVLGIGIAVVVLVAAVVVAASATFGTRHGGPFDGYGKVGVAWPAAIGDSVTWAMPLPDNPTTTDILIDSITPAGVVGLEVLGVLVSTQGCAALPTISTTFPPSGVSATVPQGAVLAALSQPCALHALLGVRRLPGSATGRIEGLRIRYHVGGIAYEDTLPWTLEVREPGT